MERHPSGREPAFLDVSPAGGRIVYLAPGRGPRARGGAPNVTDGTYADGVRAGLENLSRHPLDRVGPPLDHDRHDPPRLWRPGEGREAAALTAYLASPAGAYFSGCLLDLRGV